MERLANWCSPYTRETEGTRKCNIYRGISLLVYPEKMYAKCFEKRCREIIEPNLEDTQRGFRHGRSTTDQIFTFRKNFHEIFGIYRRSPCMLVDLLRKQMTGFLMKSCGGCYRSTVLTASYCWPSSHCIPAQKFVSCWQGRI